MYLASQISKISNANIVFETLSMGFSKFKDILDKSHVSSAPTLVDILNKLINMELVNKTVPINDKANSRKNYYSVLDNLSLFYYKYISRYSSQMNFMNPSNFYDNYIKEDFLQNFIPMQFENICKQYLIIQNVLGKINPMFKDIGKFYYNDTVNKTIGEFDIVTKDKNGYIFYEAKFTNKAIDDGLVHKEIEQIKKKVLTAINMVSLRKVALNCQSTKMTNHLF